MRAPEPSAGRPWAKFAPPPAWVLAFRLPARSEPGKLVLRSDGTEPPQRAERGPHTVFFAGTLDNAQALLNKPGPQPKDAQLILDAYQRLGAECVSKLRGTFALVIWDGTREELLCARDPMGRTPLFYAESRGELLLSCAIEALLSQAGVNRAPNRLVMAEHLCNLWPDPEQTYFGSVRRVPPGCALRVGRSGRRVYRHWDPATATQGDEWLRADPRELFEARLNEAVGRVLRRGRAGIFLSGGIDSVSVAAVAADHSDRGGLAPPWALSLAFRHPDVDEEDTQRAVATALGLPQVLIGFEQALGGQALLAASLALSAQMPTPLANCWLPGHRYLGVQGRERGCQVHLTGGGGDEWMAVSPALAADLIRSGRIPALIRLWRNQRRSYPLSLLGSFRSVVWSFGARQLLGDAGRATLERVAPSALHSRWRRRVERLAPPWIAPDAALRRDLEQRAMEVVSAPRPKNHYDGDARLALDHPLVTMEMEESFENAREIGVPVLQPFLDADLVELLYRLPPEVHFSGGRDKGLARAMLAERFPELGFARKRKVVSLSFAEAVFTAEGPRMWEALGPARALAELGVVNDKLLDAEVSATFASPEQRRYFYRMWDVMSLEAWLRSRVEPKGE